MKYTRILFNIFYDGLKLFFEAILLIVIFSYILTGFGFLMLIAAIADYNTKNVFGFLNIIIIALVLLSWIFFLIQEIKERAKKLN